MSEGRGAGIDQLVWSRSSEEKMGAGDAHLTWSESYEWMVLLFWCFWLAEGL